MIINLKLTHYRERIIILMVWNRIDIKEKIINKTNYRFQLRLNSQKIKFIQSLEKYIKIEKY